MRLSDKECVCVCVRVRVCEKERERERHTHKVVESNDCDAKQTMENDKKNRTEKICQSTKDCCCCCFRFPCLRTTLNSKSITVQRSHKSLEEK